MLLPGESVSACMGGGSSNQPGTTEVLTPGSSSKDPRLVDSLSNGWTDEKHTLFLNSIETSFVNELYNGEYNSKAFLNWLSRLNSRKRSRGYENDPKSGQLKVLRKGCWENLLGRDNNNTGTEDSSAPLYANPWIRHFQSPSIIKEKHLGSSKRVDGTETIRPSFHQTIEGHDEEATSSKLICSQDSFSSSIEVSDQNFIDEELVSGKKPSKICREKSPGTAVVHNPINEQDVPYMEVLLKRTSDEYHACVSAMNTKSSGRASEEIPGLSPSQIKAALCNGDQEVHS